MGLFTVFVTLGTRAKESRNGVVRFGLFVFDPRSGDLRKQGRKIRLEGQPVQVLARLLERPGELVTREELQEELWPRTFM
jgi:DNA-binding winged helix-turn-helix (wHTH) protein